MQRDDDIKKVLTIWNTVNNISKPTNKKLALGFVEEIASLFSAGNFYYFIFNFTTYKMEFVSESTQNVLGIPSEKFTLEKIFSILHPEDLANMHRKERASLNFKMFKIHPDEINEYKTIYLMRFILDNGEHKTILHQSKAITISEDGKIQQVISIHTDVTHLDLPIDHKVSFIAHKKPSYFYDEINDNYKLLDSVETIFSNREKEIIREISKGHSAKKIADSLNLSPHTVTTHKKNILKKSNCKNTSELIAKCIREGII